jgi:SSS family solute:Na+ symporter
MITLHLLDVVLVVLYLVLIVVVGFRAARQTPHNEHTYLLAGRSLTLPVFVMTLVSTWYGGILGIGEFTYVYGIANWFTQGLPYYVFAALFALLLAKRIRSTNLYTIPDKLHAAYGRKTALLGAVLTFLLTMPAAYVLMLSMFLQVILGWNLLTGMIVTAVVVYSYLYAGGLRSDVATDVVEFVLMFVGFVVIVAYAFAQYGGIGYLVGKLPPTHLVWHGGLGVQQIVVWFFIALWTLVDPGFHQRCYAAKDATTAQRGVLVSIFFWFVFDMLTLTTGLYARAALPQLENPPMSYPLFAEMLLPPVAKGLFYIGMLATVMSTLNTLALVSAQSLGRDFFLRMRASDASMITTSASAVRYTRAGLVVTFLLSVLLALAFPSVITIWYTVGTICIPGLLIPLGASYFPHFAMSGGYAFYSMLSGWATSAAWFAGGQITGMSVFGIEPMFPGLVVSLLVWAGGKIARRDVPLRQ